jgi:hypothetical protein
MYTLKGRQIVYPLSTAIVYTIFSVEYAHRYDYLSNEEEMITSSFN